jgi:hypothetical protein
LTQSPHPWKHYVSFLEACETSKPNSAVGPPSQTARKSVRPSRWLLLSLNDNHAYPGEKKLFPHGSILSRSVLTPKYGNGICERECLTSHERLHRHNRAGGFQGGCLKTWPHRPRIPAHLTRAVASSSVCDWSSSYTDGSLAP